MPYPPETEQLEFYKTYAEQELHKILDTAAGKEKWSIEKQPDFTFTIHIGAFALELFFGNVYQKVTKLLLMSDKQRVMRQFLEHVISMYDLYKQAINKPSEVQSFLNKLKSNIIPRLRDISMVQQIEKNLQNNVSYTRQTIASARPQRCAKLPENFVTTFVLDMPKQYNNIFDEMGPVWKQARDSGELIRIANTYIRERVGNYLKSKGKKEGSLFSWRESDSGDWVQPRNSVIKQDIQLLSWLMFVCTPLEIEASLPASFVSKNTKENGFVLFPVHDYFPLIVRSCDEKAMISAYIELIENNTCKGSYAQECSALGYTGIRVPIRLDTINNEFVPYEKEHEGEPSLSMLMLAQKLRKVLPPEFSAGFVDPDPSPKSCANCNSQLDLKFCSACKSVCYCSASCQKADWKKHKQMCQKLALDKRQQKK